MLQEGTTDRIHFICNIFYRSLLRMFYSNNVMANLQSHVVYYFVKFYFYYIVYSSVSQPPGRGPVPGPGINHTGPREAWGNYNMLQDFIIPVDN